MSPVLDPVPAANLPLAALAPGKCILFGEHSVVHGGPELVAAIDLYVQVGARAPGSTGATTAVAPNPYLRRATERFWSGRPPLDLTITSRVPRSAGLGSSAALCAATVALMGAATGGLSRPELARRAFEVERGAQGVGSPGDTSSVVAGGLVALNAEVGEELWSVSDGGREWSVRRVADPGWTWVVGYTRVPRSTADAVRAVATRLGRPDGPDLLRELRRVALEGIRAVGQEDRTGVGRWLGENHALLREIGVSHPRLEALIEAVRPSAVGAKLTGAGAGGSMLALPQTGKEVETARRIASAGGVPYVVRVEPRGAHLVGSLATAGSLPGDDPDDGAVG